MPSIRATLLRWMVVGFVVVLLVSGSLTYFLARARLRQELDDALVRRAETYLALVIEEPHEADDPEPWGGLVFDYKGGLAERDLGLLLRIATRGEQVLAESPNWPTDAVPQPPADVAAGWEWRGTIALPDGRAARAVAIARKASREVPPSGGGSETVVEGGSSAVVVVTVVGSLAATVRSETAILLAIAAGAGVGLLGVAIVVSLGVRRGLRPLANLTTALERIDPRRPKTRSLPTDCPREIEPIRRAVESLIARVGETIERERRFTDAAAHEMRTPLAELRTASDVAMRWPSDERRESLVRQSHDIGVELEELLESLLMASRSADAPASRDASDRTPVRLLELARSILAGCAPGAVDRDRITVEGSEDAVWSVPRGAATSLVRNLLENAVEYTPAGGFIRVRAEPVEGGAILRVENGPVTLSPADCERMFEPFWRADHARSGGKHRGLGLAIVDSICQSLEMERRVSVSPDGTVCVEMEMR